MNIILLDYADTKLTSETQSIAEDICKEYGFPLENVAYAHARRVKDLEKLPESSVIVCMGAEALGALLPDSPPLKKTAGALTYHPTLKTWVLPTIHPNIIYMPDGKGYNQFDIFYEHMRRAIDLCNGVLEFPPIEGHKVDWEFIGHNGTQGYKDDPKVWSGYFEATDEEIDRQWVLLDNWIFDLNDGPITFGLDTESFTTDHLQPMTMIQIYDPRTEKGYAFNWGVISSNQCQIDLWQQFLKHKNVHFILHNTKHDRKMIKQWLNVNLGDRDEDTMCLALGLTEKGNQTGLKYMSRQYCNAPFYEEGLEEWIDRNAVNYGHIRPDVLAEYGCLDVFYTYSLSRILPALVEREGTQDLIQKILLPAQRAFSEVEFAGIRVNRVYADELKELWRPLVEEAIKEVQDYARDLGFPLDPDVVKGQITREICSCVPVRLHNDLVDLRCTSFGKYLRETHALNPECDKCNKRRYIRIIDDTLNVSSPNQMQHFVFDILGMDETYEGRKTNKYFWQLNPSHEFTQLVNGYKELAYLSKNIIDGFERFIRADGRIHPDFLLFGTVTGRLAVKNPAVQTIPKHSKHAKEIRRIFLPDHGDLVIDADYSNLELYMAHHLTGDAALLEALKGDMHETTAAAMYMKAIEDVTGEERQSAKPVNFGSGYNIGAGKLSRDINLIKITGGKKSKAQEFIDAFWGKYHVWDAGRKDWIEEAMTTCQLRTETGRVRRWNLITSDNLWKVENQACNFKGQSLASDLCLTSVVKLQAELVRKGYGRVMLTVHDSIVFSIHKSVVHKAVPLIREVMTTPVFETKTPFKVDIQVGENYGDMYKYDPDADYRFIKPQVVAESV